jgi:hypothetical protein
MQERAPANATTSPLNNKKLGLMDEMQEVSWRTGEGRKDIKRMRILAVIRGLEVGALRQ